MTDEQEREFDIGPIEPHPSFIRSRTRNWTLAQGRPRRLSAGALAATRTAITQRLEAIANGDAPGTDALISNLTRALRALDAGTQGEFVPLQAVDVLTTGQWEALRDDMKDGDPARGTARFAPRPGDEKVRCLVVPDDEG
jgi:hypothetical protein